VLVVSVFAGSTEHELQCFCSSHYVFAVVFTTQHAENPSCSCYPSLLIAFWSDAPGGKVLKILADVIMLFTPLQETRACIKLSVMCFMSWHLTKVCKLVQSCQLIAGRNWPESLSGQPGKGAKDTARECWAGASLCGAG